MAKIVKKNTAAKKSTPAAHNCPYCNAEMKALNLPVCAACHATIEYCPHCGLPLEKGTKTCTSCGH